MSRLKSSINTKKLNDILSQSDDDAFLQMVWAVDALQSGRANFAKKYLYYPLEAATSDTSSLFSIHRWELETLVNRLMLTKKIKFHTGENRFTNCGNFGTCAAAVNYLRKVEDAESRLYLEKFDILSEMHRIGHRQFHWQRGYFNIIQLYR